MSAALFNLLHLSDPTLPIGGFAHSAGLETFVQQGVVSDIHSAENYIREMLSKNIYYTDAAFVSLAFDAAISNNKEKLLQLDEECQAVKSPMETRQASYKMGNRLIKIFSHGNEHAMLSWFRENIQAQATPGHYSIVFGICAAVLGIPKENALAGFYYNTAVSMVTNCVKLIPLGQQEGQLLLHSLQSLIGDLTEYSMHPDKDKIGFCCTAFDISQMQHEQLYTRLYMS
ncbi:MAG: urease accessory protein UreF [Chitinophagaceae bacterium]|nr:MAG: urease accessory protein UreF [Chitinophagaceae bacterium]